MQQLLTTKDVAEQLKAGDIVGIRLKGNGKRGMWRFTQQAVDEYLAACVYSPPMINTKVATQHNRKRQQAVPSVAIFEAAKRGVTMKF